MIKRIALATLSFTLLASGVMAGQNLIAIPETAEAAIPPDTCFAFNAGTGTITNYYNHEGNNPANPACPKAVDIPSTIGGVPVTIIGNASYPGAFTSKNLTSVIIPSSVTSIGDYAFYGNQLTSLTIPSSVTSIGDYAFSYNQLTSLTIPSSVTSIGRYAFYSNQLTSLNISNPTASMQHSSFENNPITSMTIGSITYIQQNPTTDSACFSMTGSTVTDYYSNSPLIARDNGVICGRDVTIPSSVTSIGSSAFSYNQLTSLTIPSSVTSIGSSAFSHNQLTNLSIPNSVTNIGEWAFSYNQLTSLTIPSSVTSIGDRVFRNNQLTSLTIPNSVTSIGYGTFEANSIREVTIPNSVTSIGEWAFALQTPQGSAYDRFDYDDDPASVATANQAVTEFFYTRLYTEDPTNPNNLQSAVVFHKTELDGDGNWDDPVVVGGHIVNPASAETHHVNQSNASLHEAQTFTGQLPDNSYLHDYNVSRGPTIAMPADVGNPTSEEQAAAVQALSVYYRLGNQLTLIPPTISGYLTPQPHNLTLSQATTNHTFTYKPIITEVPFKDNQSVDEGEVITNTTPPPSIAHPIITNSKLSLPAGSTCQTISNAKLMSPATIQDSENSNSNSNNQTNTIPSDITLLGGLDFTLDHCQVGGATDIAYTLGQEIDDTTNLRVYKHNPAQTNPELQIQDITSLVNFNTSQNGNTTITYSLTDGGELDQDGQVNGTIVDPIYIGILEGGGTLADTGFNVYALFALAAALLTSAVAIWRKSAKAPKRVSLR